MPGCGSVQLVAHYFSNTVAGLSDPFVMIELCPSSVYPNQTVQKTRIIKKTLHPLFDESFEL
jgi:Ca2+-dependent lipid-binding protein